LAIGIKETQDVIRQAAVLSRNEPALPAKLDPQEVGMATGPRHRKRALMRSNPAPDYLEAADAFQDEWQKLDDDIYKFLQLRKDQFARLPAPPSQQFVAEMEAQLRLTDGEYELGSFLGLLRQAADLDQTRQTYVTASEKNVFHAFARRITEGRKSGEAFDPSMVKRYRDLLEANRPTTNRGLADLFRLVSRASRMPLIGSIQEAPSLTIAVLLEVVDLATRFNQSSEGSLEFQVGPMDVFLGARTVLFNRSVSNPTLSMVKELVLDDAGLYHDDLMELLRNVGVFGSELTLLMPESLTEEGFALQGSRYSAVELVMAAGAKLAKSQEPPDLKGKSLAVAGGAGRVERAMTTLADAIVHKVQQQDSHKDRQIQSILSHFNRLLQGERRSAARVTEERQQARFDYMTAIQKASQLAKGMQTGQFPAMGPGDSQARPVLPGDAAFPGVPPFGTSSLPAVPGDDASPLRSLRLAASALSGPAKSAQPLPPLPAAVVVGRINSAEYETLLGSWDVLLSRLRKKLTAKSSTFKALASQLAKVRALDTSLAYGLTPAGSRATSRLAKLIQSDELRIRLGLPGDIAEAMEDAFSMDYPGFLASLESLLGAMYEFRPVLQGLQYRLRDRLPSVKPGFVDLGRVSRGEGFEGIETQMWADEAEMDEVALKLLLGCILLGLEMAGGSDGSQRLRFGNDGKLRFPTAADFSALGDCDPFLAYCTLLWAGKKTLGASAPGDLEANLALLGRLTPDERQAMKGKYREWIGVGNRPATLVPGLGSTHVRNGWLRGFERGFMAEVNTLYDETEISVLEPRLLELLTGIQADIDAASGVLEGEKMRLTRERVDRILE
jgi:hypothetical protein